MPPLDLTPPLRLALAYAPASARPAWQTLLALDTRLAGFVRGAREPMLAQIRLAWWRERLAADPATWPRGEPLLADLRNWGAAIPDLAPLVDGWEALLAEPPLPAAAIADFAAGRTAAIAALARHLGCAEAPGLAPAARLWALADLADHLSDPAERTAARTAAAAAATARARLPRPLRPLAVLATLAARDLAGAPRWRQALAAIRVGILGA